MDIQCELCKELFKQDETERLICNHTFCLICLHRIWRDKIASIIKCPVQWCSKQVSMEIIRQILDEKDIEIYEQTILRQMENVHQCLLPECSHYMKYSNMQYRCQFCSLYNCVSCKAAHHPIRCDDYKSLDDNQRKLLSNNLMKTARQNYAKNNAEKNRQSIIELSSNKLIPNTNIFQCETCFTIIRKKAGVSLSKCFHNFCKDCIKSHVTNTLEFPILCPGSSCNLELNHTECRELMTNYDKKCIDIVIPKISAKICKYLDCGNVVVVEGGKYWDCKRCKSRNCIKCDAIHTSLTCKEYLESLNQNSFIEKMIKAKEMMRCPECKALITKDSGCNWMKCLSCQTELCWILQTYRWGPKGHGDTSGGCKCGVDGKNCHPKCGGCIPHREIRMEQSEYSEASNNSSCSLI